MLQFCLHSIRLEMENPLCQWLLLFCFFFQDFKWYHRDRLPILGVRVNLFFGNHADLDRMHLAFTMSNNEDENESISNYLPPCVDECLATLLDWCLWDRWQRNMPWVLTLLASLNMQQSLHYVYTSAEVPWVAAGHHKIKSCEWTKSKVEKRLNMHMLRFLQRIWHFPLTSTV